MRNNPESSRFEASEIDKNLIVSTEVGRKLLADKLAQYQERFEKNYQTIVVTPEIAKSPHYLDTKYKIIIGREILANKDVSSVTLRNAIQNELGEINENVWQNAFGVLQKYAELKDSSSEQKAA